jgi:endonuclease I
LTITAESLAGYEFLHWLDLDTGLIVSRMAEYSFTLTYVRSLEGIYLPEGKVELYVYSTTEALVNRDFWGPYDSGATVTLTAGEAEDNHFIAWVDLLDGTDVSTDNPATFSMTSTRYLAAVYATRQVDVLAYYTGFEDCSKDAYAAAQLETEDLLWWFSDALIGKDTSDRKVGLKSVRMKAGYLETMAPISGLTSLSFQYGQYVSTEAYDETLTVSVSADQTTWIELSQVASTASFLTYSFDLTESWYDTKSLGPDTPLYVRIAGPASARTNIDEFTIRQDRYQRQALPVVFQTDTTPEFPNNSTRVTLDFDDEYPIALSIDDLWDPSGCVATDAITGQSSCSVYGAVDTTRPGEYPVTYYKMDAEGKYASQTITHVVLKDATLLDVDYVGYYDGIEGLYGEALMLALRAILWDGFVPKTYDDARQILALTDVGPANPANVITIYSRDSVRGDWAYTEWNREHVWPNSRLGVERVDGSDRSIASDLHNLRPALYSVNSSRSNKIFSDYTSPDTYDPGQDRGEVARICFYMVTMYEELSLVDEILPNDPLTNYTPEGAKMSLISKMMVWHFVDTVDASESHRNDVIYSYQFNRNPFIDHPELVELIWFDSPYLPLA